jgi:uncharacterized protein (TIGR00725 family)
MRTYVAVVGAGGAQVPAGVLDAAEAVGRAVAEAGAVLVCGGRDGVMEAACRGAKSAGGTTVGILPGSMRAEANRYVDVALPTGLGEARNALVVRAADAVVAVDGGYGTLSEIALALVAGTPVVGLGTWALQRPGAGGATDAGVVAATDPAAAVALALALALEAPAPDGD